MKLRGFSAIEFAEREGILLNKDADPIDPAATELTVAEAEAIAADHPETIWIEVSEEDYHGEPKNMEPER